MNGTTSLSTDTHQHPAFPSPVSRIVKYIMDSCDLGIDMSINCEAGIVNYYKVTLLMCLINSIIYIPTNQPNNFSFTPPPTHTLPALSFNLSSMWCDILYMIHCTLYTIQAGGSTMGPHQDDAELTYAHPIVSISVGRSAIFCIGLCRHCNLPGYGLVYAVFVCML